MHFCRVSSPEFVLQVLFYLLTGDSDSQRRQVVRLDVRSVLVNVISQEQRGFHKHPLGLENEHNVLQKHSSGHY